MGVEDFIKDLISKMTLEEKVAQLTSIQIENLVEGRKLSKDKMRKYLKYGMGEITRNAGSVLRLSPREAARFYN